MTENNTDTDTVTVTVTVLPTHPQTHHAQRKTIFLQIPIAKSYKIVYNRIVA